MQVDHSCLFSFRLDALLPNAKERPVSRRLLGRLQALNCRVRRALKHERHYIDASLISALEDFVLHIRQAPIRDLYDATTISDPKEAEMARGNIIAILERVRNDWASRISYAVVRPPNIGEKMSITAIIN